MHPTVRTRLAELAALFFRLGATAFGGPAAHLAMIHDETVRRRQWLDDQRFLDLVGATNLIPGPNSTEMAIHIGFLRAGWRGLLVAGASFIVPAVCIVTALAWGYVRVGSAPELDGLLYGIKPVVIAIIAQAIWFLGRKAVTGAGTTLIAALVATLYLAGANEIALLLGGGAAVMAARNLPRLRRGALGSCIVPLGGLGAFSAAQAHWSYPALFLTCLKIGSVWYGSGYVLLAFLRADFVAHHGWITERQLLDAIAVGQVTPGPLFTTVTFIGYLLGGVAGALLATLGIFIPSIVLVSLTNPIIPRIRRSPWAVGLLDGINASSLGLMAAVTWQLGVKALCDPFAVLVACASLALLLRYRINSTWLSAGGALLGLGRTLL
ncbi:MAG: chromate efflux transporter [Candidatus Aureabacteria bacterium]|nr:chromate efflux transporter [Candidatus Auribacterota bacterium]